MVAPVILAAIPSLIETIGGLLSRWIPDPEQRQRAVMEIVETLQTSDAAQVEINKIEAAGDWVQRNWRPALGWGGVVGVWYVWLAQPVLEWLSINAGWLPPPKLDITELLTLLFGLLGLSAYRSIERVRGVIPPGR